MLAGMRRAAAAYASAGANVVFDDMLLDKAALADWAHALAAVDSLLVRLTAPLDVLLAREAARTLHPTPGLVAGHSRLHDALAADLVIDTAAHPPAEAADLVLHAQRALKRTLEEYLAS
jgi:chloramphenicol 3-O phosphotransferase